MYTFSSHPVQKKKVNSKWDKDVKVKPETVKLFEEWGKHLRIQAQEQAFSTGLQSLRKSGQQLTNVTS